MKLILLFLFVTVLKIGSTTTVVSELSCKNEENRNIDWFYLYKFPRIHNNEINAHLHGLYYAFITPTAPQRWTKSDNLINETSSFPGRTLSPLLNNSDVLLIAYNDEVPDGPTDVTNGHTKGLVATDGKQAIWLIHSVPKYPHISTYGYPSNGETYGQSFLCVTLDAGTELNKVFNQLLFNEPNVYYSRIPAGLVGKYPDLENIIHKKWKTTAPYKSLVDIKTLGGTEFKSFAKGRHFNADLYEDWLTSELSVSLLVETWRNSAGKLPSNCTRKQKVYNVAVINDKDLDFMFKSSADHSKWTVSKTSDSDWICVGDINRDKHQFVRGGGTLCHKNDQVANAYRGIVQDVQDCDGTIET